VASVFLSFFVFFFALFAFFALGRFCLFCGPVWRVPWCEGRGGTFGPEHALGAPFCVMRSLV